MRQGTPRKNPPPPLRTRLYAIERLCSKCGDWWPADAEFFFRDADQPDGLTSKCKACWVEVHRKLPAGEAA